MAIAIFDKFRHIVHKKYSFSQTINLSNEINDISLSYRSHKNTTSKSQPRIAGADRHRLS